MSAVPQEPQRPVAPAEDVNADLGFGSVVTRESRRRLLNRDGTFNVRREGLSAFQSLSFYHYILTMSWPRFLGILAVFYVAANALFALAYVACGPGALTGWEGQSPEHAFARAFFFSVHTLATIGYGSITPVSLSAHIVVTIEALVGLLAFALVAGFVFARFARPTARVVFSERAVVAPYKDISAFMFRIVNQRSSELVEMDAKVILSVRKRGGTSVEREFIQLKLERSHVVFFPLSWTIVHPIDADSPLRGCDPSDLTRRDAEFLVLLNGFDETFSQTVHTRTSYRADEVVWGARFRGIFNPPRPDGTISVDIRKLHEFDVV